MACCVYPLTSCCRTSSLAVLHHRCQFTPSTLPHATAAISLVLHAVPLVALPSRSSPYTVASTPVVSPCFMLFYLPHSHPIASHTLLRGKEGCCYAHPSTSFFILSPPLLFPPPPKQTPSPTPVMSFSCYRCKKYT